MNGSQAGASGSRSLAVGALAAPPVAIAVLALFLAFSGGGVDAAQWTEYAVAIPAALAVLAAVGALPEIPRRVLPALAAAALFAAWATASLAWSEAPGATSGAALRTLLLVTTFAVGAIYAAREASAVALCAAVAATGVVITLGVLGELVTGVGDAFISGRLAWPIAYSNGVAALLFLPAPLLVVFASTNRLRPAIRALIGGLATSEVSVGLLAQSRGATAALLGAFGVAILTSRPRSGTSVTVALVVLPTVPIFGYLALPDVSSPDAMRQVALRITIVALVAAAAVWVFATWERRKPLGPRAGRTIAILWLGVALCAFGAFAVRTGNPIQWGKDRWGEFSHVAHPAPTHETRFGSASSNRYDYWRVSLLAAADHPLDGVGDGAFSVPWFQNRLVDENVSDPHSFLFGALAELGIPGLVLVLVFVGLPFVRRRRSAATPLLASASAFALFHASVDWSLSLPALAIPAMLVLGAGIAGREGEAASLAGPRSRVVVAAVSFGIVLLAVPGYLAAQRMANADVVAGTSTTNAIALARSAARLAPLDAAPLVQASALAELADRPQLALELAREAVAREPDNWVAWSRVRTSAQAMSLNVLLRQAEAHVLELNPLLPPTVRDEPATGPLVAPSKCLADPRPVTGSGVPFFTELQQLGVRTWVEPLGWFAVAKRRPANPRDPSDPAYHWPAVNDRYIAEAVAAGVEPVMYITGAPAWANGGRNRYYAPTNPRDFADFAVAAVLRYPQVRRWQIWSEPTRSNSFRPQGGNGTTAPRLYARILDAAYGAMHAVRSDVVVIGGNMHPNGRNDDGTTAPATFLANMRLPNGRPPRLDLFGINPYSERRPDITLPVRPGRLDINDLDWLLKQIDVIYPGRRLKLFIGEFGWLTGHGNNGWYWYVSESMQATDLVSAYRLAASTGRVDTFCWFELRDRPTSTMIVDGSSVYTNWTSGLERADGSHKPSYDRFRAVPSGPDQLGPLLHR